MSLFYTASDVVSIMFSCLRFLQQPKPNGQDWQSLELTGPILLISHTAIISKIKTEQQIQWHRQQNVFSQKLQKLLSLIKVMNGTDLISIKGIIFSESHLTSIKKTLTKKTYP